MGSLSADWDRRLPCDVMFRLILGSIALHCTALMWFYLFARLEASAERPVNRRLLLISLSDRQLPRRASEKHSSFHVCINQGFVQAVPCTS